MSPQLATWTYGFLAQSFAQAVRNDGFRPIVFLQSGLWLAIFTAMSAMAAIALWRQVRASGRGLVWLLGGLWLSGVMFLSNSLGALGILVLLLPIVFWLPVRGQMVMAGLVATVMLVYPMLRGAGLVPVDTVYSLTASLSAERAQSFKFRLDNEDILLAHANEKAVAGWGGFGRSRVYNPETGVDISITDGMWIIVMGTSGWLGYVATYGLLTAPILLLFLRRRQFDVDPATAGLCLILVANMIDMISNATLTPITWLVAGALAGRTKFLAPNPDAATQPAPERRPLRSRSGSISPQRADR